MYITLSVHSNNGSYRGRGWLKVTWESIPSALLHTTEQSEPRKFMSLPSNCLHTARRNSIQNKSNAGRCGSKLKCRRRHVCFVSHLSSYLLLLVNELGNPLSDSRTEWHHIPHSTTPTAIDGNLVRHLTCFVDSMPVFSLLD